MNSLARLVLLPLAGLVAAGPAAAWQDNSWQEQALVGRRFVPPRDATALARLRRNSGISLQWIGWDRRGRLDVSEAGGRIRLHGDQRQRGGPGRLYLEGGVLGMTADRFRFHGRIVITDTPDIGRNCVRDGDFEFRITGRRRYWRLQQMEQCDGLTDYVDIYF
jgi:hypothetical protein